ncbi:MAG: chemotaxis protein CheW [Sideroxyarcus sp.]|nr:chemotaxis protein CheW [Sideroxyarcus sp.]
MGALATTASPVAAAEAADIRQYLTFALGSEMFAVGTLSVKEIIEYGHLTEVPMMPGFIRGVINLRGAVVPVIDLAARFGRNPTQITRRTCIVIIEVPTGEERHDIGVVVDAVSEVLEIPAGEIEPAPAFGAKIRTDFIQGMGKVNGKFVILLDVGKVLSVDEISTLASVAGQVPQAMAA